MVGFMSRAAAVGAALCVCGGAVADEESTIARLIADEIGLTPVTGIPDRQRGKLGAIFEFEDLTCPFNKDGGMITKIVNEAMATVIPADDFEIGFVFAGGHGDDHNHETGHERPSFEGFRNQHEDQLADLASGQGNQLTFPWFRPNCASPAFLTDHTRNLCNNYQWSAPLYEVLIGTYLGPDFAVQPQNHAALYGRAICQSGQELPNMLYERGVSDLNARLIEGGSPRACFDMLLSGEADVAIMPLLTGNRLQREYEEFEGIRSAFKLDIEMAVHAIGPVGDAKSARHIQALNLGVANLRASGVWDEIVNEFFSTHDHGMTYAAAQKQ